MKKKYSWKKISQSIYKNSKGKQIGILKWSPKEYHILKKDLGRLKKIKVTKTKSNALKFIKEYMKRN